MRGSVVRLLGIGAAFTLGAAAVTAVAPASSVAAGGLFLWTNTDGVPTPLPSPANEKCFDTFNATRAINLTDSDAVLSKDGLCSAFLTVVAPGEAYDGAYGSVGFTPPGAVDH